MKILLDANICLDLLDTSRPTSNRSVEWYLANKDNEEYEFFFSGDFITTFYYVLTAVSYTHLTLPTIVGV